MLKVWMMAAALVLAACSSEQAAPGEAKAEPAANAAPAGAEDQILAWARGQYNSDGPHLIEPVTAFYGDYSGDGAADALAFAYYDLGGSGAGLGVALFRNESGRMVFVRMVDDVYGAEPRDAVFTTGRINITTLMPGPNDPHCCPTQPREWTINTN